jgi:hypothetical protein
MEEKQCRECKQYTTGLVLDELCVDCFEQLFAEDIYGEEPDFELEHEVAEVKEVEPIMIELANGHSLEGIYSDTYTVGRTLSISSPKRYKLDWSKVTSFDDVVAILRSVLGNDVTVYENYENFEKLKPLLKDDE